MGQRQRLTRADLIIRRGTGLAIVFGHFVRQICSDGHAARLPHRRTPQFRVQTDARIL